jgi:hypothetical protein
MRRVISASVTKLLLHTECNSESYQRPVPVFFSFTNASISFAPPMNEWHFGNTFWKR